MSQLGHILESIFQLSDMPRVREERRWAWTSDAPDCVHQLWGQLPLAVRSCEEVPLRERVVLHQMQREAVGRGYEVDLQGLAGLCQE